MLKCLATIIYNNIILLKSWGRLDLVPALSEIRASGSKSSSRKVVYVSLRHSCSSIPRGHQQKPSLLRVFSSSPSFQKVANESLPCSWSLLQVSLPEMSSTIAFTASGLLFKTRKVVNKSFCHSWSLLQVPLAESRQWGPSPILIFAPSPSSQEVVNKGLRLS